MAFSFTPGQIAPQGSQAQGGPSGTETGAIVAPVAGPPSDSPFLFIRERGQPFSVMAGVQIVLVVVAILSVIISATMYSYSVYLTSQIETKRKEINDKDAEFPTYPYADMLRLSNRMATLNELLKSYISPRSPLKFLESVIENEVVFDKFNLARDKNGSYKISFSADAANYSVLIQQLAALNLSEYSKITPTPKLGALTESDQLIKINVTTPVLVQGKLPDDVVFYANPVNTSDVGTSTAETSAPDVSSSSKITP